MAFVTPSVEPLHLRLSLAGPPGSGKTFTALSLATALGGRVAVIDTERGSAKRYHAPRGPFRFVVDELADTAPQRYVESIHEAARAGVNVLVVDSMSHAWDGLLDMVGGGGKQGWGRARPVEREFWDSLLTFPGHLIATFRVRTAYVEDDKTRKQVKAGLEAIQRQGTEYEFDVCLRLEDEGKVCAVDKTRCSALAGRHFTRPGANVVDLLRPWLEAGVRADPASLLAAIGELRAQAPAEWHQQIDYDVQQAGQDAEALREVRGKLADSLEDLGRQAEPAPAAPPAEAPSKPTRKPIGSPVAAGGGA